VEIIFLAIQIIPVAMMGRMVVVVGEDSQITIRQEITLINKEIIKIDSQEFKIPMPK
jgi:hypothetical protein